MTRSEAKIPEEDSPSLADHIRDAARDSGLSVYRLAKEAEVDQSTLNKFLSGGRNNLTLEIADRLFRVLGLRVTRKGRRLSGKTRPAETPGGE
jgi:transcriptional regulator with XRE-family HTH domain